MSKNKKLDIDSLVEGLICIDEYSNDSFVNSSNDKCALHPARYFKELFMSKLVKSGLNDEDIVAGLGMSAQSFQDFINEKVTVTSLLAQRLTVLTGMPVGFWLRAQSKFDDSDNRVE